jgi:hypothetical protein
VTIDQVLTIAALDARNESRINDQMDAMRIGAHFWIAAVIYRSRGPEFDVEVDPEGLCGYINVHCANCGVFTNDDPVCTAV